MALFLGAEVVADVSVEDSATVLGFVRVADHDGDGHPYGSAVAENVASLLSSGFSRDVGPASEVEYVDGGEFVGEAGSHSRFGVVVYVAVGGDEGNDASFSEPVRGPSDGHLVQVLEGVLQLGGATGGVCFSYPVFEMLVWDFGVVVACAFLSR